MIAEALLLKAAEIGAIEVTKKLSLLMVAPVLSGIKSIAGAVADQLTGRFSDYMARQYARHYYINTLVFQNQKSLESLYVPLTLVPEGLFDLDSQAKIKMSRYRKELVPTHRRVLITDTAGMGKSTLMRFMLIQIVKSLQSIPVFVELRHLSSKRTLLNLLEQELNLGLSGADAKFDNASIVKILKSGSFTFLLDGFDEIPLSEREAVTTDIKSVVDSYSENCFVITSRPEEGLAAFSAFKRYGIAELTVEEAIELLKKYDESTERSEQLIAKIQSEEYSDIRRFLTNPLLTTLLYRCYEYKNIIPLRKHVFYRQVYDALYDWHDSTKDGYNTREKLSKLDIDSFHRALRALAFVMLLAGRVEGTKDEVLGWIRTSRTYCHQLAYSESNLLEDAIRAVPVMCKDGDQIRWSHKSLCEYFAAQFIVADSGNLKYQILEELGREDRIVGLTNLLDILYDLDQVAFKRAFVVPLAERYKQFVNALALPIGVAASDVVRRRELLFLREFGVIRHRRAQGDELRMIEDAIEKSSVPWVRAQVGGRYFDLNGRYFKRDGTNGIDEGSSTKTLLFCVANHFSVVLGVLARKKDELVITRPFFEREVPSRAKFMALFQGFGYNVEMIDAAGAKRWNEPAQYKYMNALLGSLIPCTVNESKLLQAPSIESMEEKATALTTSLLQSFSKQT